MKTEKMTFSDKATEERNYRAQEKFAKMARDFREASIPVQSGKGEFSLSITIVPPPQAPLPHAYPAHASDTCLQWPSEGRVSAQLDQGFLQQLTLVSDWQQSSEHRIRIPLRDGSTLLLQLADLDSDEAFRLAAQADL